MAAAVTLRLESYDLVARRRMAAAQALADERRSAEVEPVHLLYRLLEPDGPIRDAVASIGVDPDDVLVEAELVVRRLRERAHGAAYLSPRLLELLGRAEGEAARGGESVGVEHLLLATAQESAGGASEVLRACGLSAPLLRDALSRKQRGERAADKRGGPIARYGIDLTQLAAQGRFDATVGRDAELRRILQVLARRYENNPLLVGEPGVGKSAIVQALALRMARGDVPRFLRDKRLVELDIGALSAGVRLRGELALRVAELLGALRDDGGQVIVYLRELASLLGDGALEGGAGLIRSALRNGELRLLAVADPSAAQRLFIDGGALSRHFVRIDVEPPNAAETLAILRGVVRNFEIAHGLTISDPALNAAASLARRYVPHVQLPKSAIDLIDEAAALVRVELDSVPTELDRMQRRLESVQQQLAALADDADADSADSRSALSRERDELVERVAERRARWNAELEALERIKELREEIAAAEREAAQAEAGDERERASELRQRTLPELTRTLQAAELSFEAMDEHMVRDAVGEADVANVVSTWTGIPVTRMLEGEAEKLLRMESRLGARVIGQPRAVEAVCRAVRRARVGLRDSRRPIGSFLFLGTTGVGKTELAKALAEFLFDDEASLTRLDMSEFMEKHTVARLLGAPPGYVDSEEGGFLTEAVRRRPYSVLLFDEIEKAHPDVFNILLQVLDDGRLTDSRGRLAHFADTVIILTSNIGARRILEHGSGSEGLNEAIEEELQATLRPEFLNRIDNVVIFETLDKADLAKIADLQLTQLSRMLDERRLRLELGDEAKARLVDLGFEPAFGARPLQRVIRRELQEPLAEELLRGRFSDGDTIRVDVDDGAFAFQRQA